MSQKQSIEHLAQVFHLFDEDNNMVIDNFNIDACCELYGVTMDRKDIRRMIYNTSEGNEITF